MEIWDLYDENRNLTGKTHIRGQQLPDDNYHLVVHVWIKNNNDQYLISQRSASRKVNPLMWECIGGSVLSGETSLQGALRETKEEVGIELNATNGKLIYSKIRKEIEGKRFNDIMDVWLFEYNGNVDLNNASTDEVAQTKWLTIDEIKELFNQGKFVWTLKYFLTHIAKNP